MIELVRNGFGFRKEEVTFLPDEVWSGEWVGVGTWRVERRVRTA